MPLFRLKVRRVMEQHGEVVVEAPSAEKAVDRWMRRVRKAPNGRQYGLRWSAPMGPSHSVTHVKHREYVGTEHEREVYREVPEQWIIDSYRSTPKG